MSPPEDKSECTPPPVLLSALDGVGVGFGDQGAADRLRRLLEAGVQWSLVKHNLSRTVWRGQGPGGVVYLKHFHSRSLAHRLRRQVGSGDASREVRFSRELARAGVSVPEALAWACRDGQEWIVTGGVEPSTPADAWHARRLADGDSRSIEAALAAMAQLVGRMHAAGIVHRDLHCGNILVCDEGRRLVLMDLHRAGRAWRLSRRVRAANLAQLYQDRRLLTTRSQRLRFLRIYLEASSASGSLRGWVRLIEPPARRHTRRLNAQRERRIFGTNRYFARLGGRRWRRHVVLAGKRRIPGSTAAGLTFTPEQWREALAEPEALLAGPGVEVVKDSPSSLVVRRRLRVGPHELDVFVKRSRRKRPVRLLTDMLRPSRAMRAFRLGHALLGRHIHTALPLAAMERRIGPVLVDSILITEAVADAVHLNKFLARHLGPAENGLVAQAFQPVPPPGDPRRRPAQHVLGQLGRLLRRFHQEGFAHRDLKATNLLVHWQAHSARPPEIVLVDLDGLKPVRRVTRRQEFRGLMRLNVSLLECTAVNRAGRLRMLMGYLRRPGSGPIRFKPYWHVLQEWSGRTIRRQIAARQRRQKTLRRNPP